MLERTSASTSTGIAGSIATETGTGYGIIRACATSGCSATPLLAGALGAAYLSVLFLQLNPRVPALPDEPPAAAGDAGCCRTASTCRRSSTASLVLRRDRRVRASSRPAGSASACSRGCWPSTPAAAAALMWLNLGLYAPMLALDTVAADGGRRGHRDGARARRSCSSPSRATRSAAARGRVGVELLALAARGVAGAAAARARAGRVARARRRARSTSTSACAPAAAAARRDDPARRRFARLHLDGGARRAAPELRADPRLAAPRCTWRRSAHAAGPGLDDGGDRQAAPEDRRAVGGAVPRARRRTTRSSCCPITASRTGSCTSASSATIPHSSSSPRARPLWSILATAGLTAGRRELAAHAPGAADARATSSATQFYRPDDPSLEPDDPAALYPPEDLPLARSAGDRRRPSLRRRAARTEIARTAARRRQSAASWRTAPAQPFVIDAMYEQVAQALQAKARPRLSAVRYHAARRGRPHFLRYAMPREFGDVTPEERRQYGPVLEGALRARRRDRRPGDGDARPRRPAARRVRLRHGAAQPRQAAARARDREPGSVGHARGRAGRVPAGLRAARSRPAASRGRRSSTSRRRSSISSACRSRATWTATRGPTSSGAPSPTTGRSPHPDLRTLSDGGSACYTARAL